MITSFVTDWAPIVTDVAESIRADGADACSQGVFAADLENGGTLLAPFHDFEDKIPADVKTQIADAQAQIEAGTLDPVTGETTGTTTTE